MIKKMLGWIRIRNRCVRAQREAKMLLRSLKSAITDYNLLDGKHKDLSTAYKKLQKNYQALADERAMLRFENQRLTESIADLNQEQCDRWHDIIEMNAERLSFYKNILKELTLQMLDRACGEQVYEKMAVLDPQGTAVYKAVISLLGPDADTDFIPKDGGDESEGLAFKLFIDWSVFKGCKNSRQYRRYADTLWRRTIQNILGSLSYASLTQMSEVCLNLVRLQHDTQNMPNFHAQRLA